MSTPKEQLKEKVVSLVKEFVRTEGGITKQDLQLLFENFASMPGEVAAALAGIPIVFTEHQS